MKTYQSMLAEFAVAPDHDEDEQCPICSAGDGDQLCREAVECLVSDIQEEIVPRPDDATVLSILLDNNLLGYGFEECVLAVRMEMHTAELEAELTRLRDEISALRADKHRLIQDVMESLSVAEDDHEYMESEISALRAQLAAAQAGEWTPVGHREYIECKDGSLKVSDEMTGYFLFATGKDGDLIRRKAVVELPDDIRLCRRVPAEEVMP